MSMRCGGIFPRPCKYFFTKVISARYDDDVNIIVINYEYSDGMGGPYLMWLTDDEVELVQNFRDKEEDKSTK